MIFKSQSPIMGKLPERGVGDSIVPTAASTSERSGKGAPDRVVNRNAMEIGAPQYEL